MITILIPCSMIGWHDNYDISIKTENIQQPCSSCNRWASKVHGNWNEIKIYNVKVARRYKWKLEIGIPNCPEDKLQIFSNSLTQHCTFGNCNIWSYLINQIVSILCNTWDFEMNPQWLCTSLHYIEMELWLTWLNWKLSKV